MSHPPHDAPRDRPPTRADRGGAPTEVGTEAEVEIACVGAVVHSAGGALLLVQRAHAPAIGGWSLPGGHVEPGEDDAAALVREVREETGLDVTAGAWVGTVRRPAGPGRTYVVRDYRGALRQAGAVGREFVGGGAVGSGAVEGGAPAPTAGDDAADARWVDAAAYAALDAAGALVPGLTPALDAWGVLPR